MEPSLYRYILTHSRNGQILLALLALVSFPLVYILLELPKKIINMLQGEGIPEAILGYPVDEVSYLAFLSLCFLSVVLASGGIKYVINVYRGVLGERLLRRFRYELYERILRFPPPYFKRVSQSELIPMITAETEPLAEFIGESYTLPLFQGGMLITYVVFIFQQDPYLGLASIALYPFQLYVIPKLQRKVNRLSKERVRTVRSLSGRIGESVSGINEIHANDTSHYERAHISHHLGIIYGIRYAIYRRKFFIKFLNNFIAQLTPFFFYSVGGYFVLRGDLTIGSMVAVLVAYKDLAGPWKELLRYYQRKEDIKVKYTQVIDQFSPAGMTDPAKINQELDSIQLPTGDWKANNVSYSEDQLYFNVNSVNFTLKPDQHVAAVGLSNSGKDELAGLMSRLINPTSGSLTKGMTKMSDLSEAVTGHRVGYVDKHTYLFTGTIRDNLLYPLKHRPVTDDPKADSNQRAIESQLAVSSGNSKHHIGDQWIDSTGIGTVDDTIFSDRIREIIETVDLGDEIYQLGLTSQVDQSKNLDLARRIMKAREQLHDRLSQEDHIRLTEPFDQDKFNTNLTVAENLLFGTIYDDSIDSERLAENPYIRQVLDESQLTEDFLAAGKQIVEVMLDLFSDVEPDSELFEQYSFINADDLAKFQQLKVRVIDQSTAIINTEDRVLLLSMPFKLIVARHRLGLIDDSIQLRILTARKLIRHQALDNNLGIEFFDQTQFNPKISIQDNILFGKLAYGQVNVQTKINLLIADVVKELELRNDIIDAGLNFEVGVAGARLLATQRQKIGLARGLIKAPDILVINEATAILDTAAEKRLISQIRQQMKSRCLFWVLARTQLAVNFDNVIVMERGKIVGNGKYRELENSNQSFQQLLSD
jgi:ABC-type bacteriocin/lantibiotic exporter with double-glycine peptidase domain